VQVVHRREVVFVKPSYWLVIDQIAVDHGAEVTRQKPGGGGGALGQFEVIPAPLPACPAGA
jgi:hypothetical protein